MVAGIPFAPCLVAQTKGDIMASKDTRSVDRDDNPENRDPITKAPGAHPVGPGIGAAAGGAAGVCGAVAAGALAGSAAGPVGAAVGAAVGAVAGGLIGKGVAEAVNPTEEHDYWRRTYATRPYAQPGTSYDDYGLAYEYGWQSRSNIANRKIDEVEPTLGQDWEN